MPAPANPSTCLIRNWVAFEPGYHKEQLYSLADCRAMGANFQRLSTGASPLIVPRVKIGHDVEERLTSSLGFPALGRIYGMRVAPDGRCAFDLEIPTQIGALCNAGWYRDGSIEIAPPLPDPDDATKKLYPVLVAISLLGEEQPAVPLRYPMPRAVFADGREVPGEQDLTPLATAMAEVARSFSAKYKTKPVRGQFSFRGQKYLTAVVCFSAMTPLPKGIPVMTDEQKAALAAPPFSYTPEQIAAMEQAMAAPPPIPSTQMAQVPPTDPNDPTAGLKQFADDPNTPPYAKAMMSAFSAFAANCNKRFSATEAAVGDVQKLKPDAQMAAQFSREYQERVKAEHKSAVESAVDQAVLAGGIMARDKSAHIAEGLTKSNTQTFSAGHAHAGKTEFAVWRDDLLARKSSHMFLPDPALAGPDPGNPLEDGFVRATLAQMGAKGREIAAGSGSTK